MRDQMATAGGISEGNPFIQIVIILRINIINMLINIVIRAGYVMSRLLKGDEGERGSFDYYHYYHPELTPLLPPTHSLCAGVVVVAVPVSRLQMGWW